MPFQDRSFPYIEVDEESGAAHLHTETVVVPLPQVSGADYKIYHHPETGNMYVDCSKQSINVKPVYISRLLTQKNAIPRWLQPGS